MKTIKKNNNYNLNLILGLVEIFLSLVWIIITFTTNPLKAGSFVITIWFFLLWLVLAGLIIFFRKAILILFVGLDILKPRNVDYFYLIRKSLFVSAAIVFILALKSLNAIDRIDLGLLTVAYFILQFYLFFTRDQRKMNLERKKVRL